MFYQTADILLMIQGAHKTDQMCEWNNGLLNVWERDILINIGAINDEMIIADYPVLKQKDAFENETTFDLGGNVFALNAKAEEIRRSSKNPGKIWIEYTPRSFVNFKAAMKIWRETNAKQDYAREINTPPIEEPSF